MASIDRRNVLKGAAAGRRCGRRPGRRRSRRGRGGRRATARRPRALRHPGRQGLPEGRRQPRQPELHARCAASTAATSAGCAAPGSTASRAASPTATTRAPRSRSTACSTSSRRSATSSPSTASPAQTKWRYDQTRGSLTRRGVAVGGGQVFTQVERELRHRARPGDRPGRLGAPGQRVRQHREGRRRLPRRPAVLRHQRRPAGRGPRARRPQRRPALALLGHARARASSATTPGRATPGWRAAPRRGSTRPSTRSWA